MFDIVMMIVGCLQFLQGAGPSQTVQALDDNPECLGTDCGKLTQ